MVAVSLSRDRNQNKKSTIKQKALHKKAWSFIKKLPQRCCPGVASNATPKNAVRFKREIRKQVLYQGLACVLVLMSNNG